MNVTELVEEIYRISLPEIQKNNGYKEKLITNREIVFCCADDLMYDDDGLNFVTPEGEALVSEFVSDPKEYIRLQQKNVSVGLTEKELSEYQMLFGMGFDKMIVDTAKMCIEKYNIE